MRSFRRARLLLSRHTDGVIEFLEPLSNLTTLNLTGAKLTDADSNACECSRN